MVTDPIPTRGHAAHETGWGRLAFDGRFRLAFVLFGGMIALQSSPTFDPTKIAYLVGTALCLAGALAAVWRAHRTPAVRLGAPWIVASAALAMLLAVSFLVARDNGTSITDWVRDVAAYGLFAAVPVLALDGQASVSRKVVVGMLVIAGLLGGVSWAIEWLGRREILELPIARLVFPSGQLPGLLYLFALAMALTTSRRRGVWVVVAGLILGLFLVTGTRSSLLLLIGPLAMAAFAGRARMGSSIRMIVSHGAVAVTLVLAFQLALALPVMLGPGRPTGVSGASGSPAPSVPTVLGDRLGSIPRVLGNPASDQSIQERIAQYRAAWALFVSKPILGVGPGHSIDWVDSSGLPRKGFTADTPLVLPAKFGLLGILVLCGAAAAYALTVRTAMGRDRQSVITLTLVGYGVWTLLSLPLGFPVEDKGASLALMLLLSLAFHREGSDTSAPSALPND